MAKIVSVAELITLALLLPNFLNYISANILTRGGTYSYLKVKPFNHSRPNEKIKTIHVL